MLTTGKRTFRFEDLRQKALVTVAFIVSPSSVIFFAADKLGDIEVAFSHEDGRTIVALLERALGQRPELHLEESQVHRFTNRDGGEEAHIIVERQASMITITLERSDEGSQSVAISDIDARTLASELTNALSTG